ncbi:MAG: BatD family protein [Planctomycetota bacterium]
MKRFRFSVFGFRLPALALVSALACGASAGEAPQLQAQLGAGQIYLGESVDYQVTLRNAKDPAPPDLSPFAAEFNVAPHGDQSLDQTSVFIVNGQMTRQVVYGHIYAYRLTPKHAGSLTVPAPSAVVEGQRLAGPVLTLHVIAPEKQDLAVMEIVAKPPKVFPTQPFDVTLRILIKPLPDVNNRDPLLPLCQAGQVPALQINWENPPEGLSCSEDLNAWLQKHLAAGGHGFSINGVKTHSNDPFSIFEGGRSALFDLSAGRERRAGLNGAPIEYFAYELKRSFTAKQSGTYTFGPATLKGMIVDGMAAGRRGQYSGRQLFVVAPAQTVEVRTVPTPRPPSFCGGVGNYKVTAAASPTALRIGDPLTLTLSFETQPGSGSLDLISPPDLTANAKLAEGFDIIDKAPTGEAKGGVKHFAYGLRTKKAGPGIPPITVTLFNPETERFVDVLTEPLKLNISASAQLNAGNLVGALPAGQSRELRSHQEGIFQNVVDVAELGDQRVRPVSYLLAVAAMWLLYGGLFMLVSNWRRKSGDVAWQRRQRALSEARKTLAEARQAAQDGKPEEAARATRAALVGLIANMRNRQAAGMTAQDAGTILAQAGASSEIAAQTVQVLETIEALAYGSAAALDGAALQARVENLLPLLHTELGARR